MNGLALCAGIGGLELGLKLALGDGYRCVCYVEREGYAAATLVARMEASGMDRAPIWDDVISFDGRPWRGAVDLVSAGFPCQPFSVAGKRRGLADDRWIWPDIARVIGDVAPRYVFLENVPGLIRHGLLHVLGDLADLGFAAEWDVFSAAEVGASHLRKRLFILAYAGCRGDDAVELQPQFECDGSPCPCAHGRDMAVAERKRLETQSGERSESSAARSPDATHARGGAMADTMRGGRRSAERNDDARQHDAPGGVAVGNSDGDGLPKLGREAGERECHADGHGGAVGVGLADADRLGWGEGRQRGEPGAEEPASAHLGRIPIFAPGPRDWAAWHALLAFAPGLEPAIRRDADGISHRVDRLRALGNGVVPVVAAVAFLRLRDRLEGRA